MKNRISARQLCAAGFTGLLSLSAASAWVDWRGALLAAPVVLAAVWAAARAGERAGGMLKGRGGRALALLYILWGEFTAGAVLALCGERLSAAGGQGGPLWPTVLAAVPVLWLAAGKPEGFARAAELFYLAMLAVLVFIVLLGAGQVEARWLLAPAEDLWRSVLTAAGLGCMWVYAVLLWNGRGQGEKKRFVGWAAAGGLTLAGMAALAAGSLSPALTAQVQGPFFLMTVGLGRTARVESLVALLWLVADVTLLGLLAQSCRGVWRDVLGLPGEGRAGAALTAAALVLALVLEEYGRPAALVRTVIPAGGLILGGAVPLLLWAAGDKSRGEKPPFPPESGRNGTDPGEEKGREKKF